MTDGWKLYKFLLNRKTFLTRELPDKYYKVWSVSSLTPKVFKETL